MKCPVCRNSDHTDFDLHAKEFAEDIKKCGVCGTVWSVSHGLIEIVQDTQEKSFLEAQSECVESDDYNMVGDKSPSK